MFILWHVAAQNLESLSHEILLLVDRQLVHQNADKIGIDAQFLYMILKGVPDRPPTDRQTSPLPAALPANYLKVVLPKP